MAALSLFCERAGVDYSFETCIGLPTYIVPGKPSQAETIRELREDYSEADNNLF